MEKPSMSRNSQTRVKLRRLFYSSACTCLLAHVDRFLPLLPADGSSPYSLLRLFAGGELLAEDGGSDESIDVLARAWNRLARHHRCTLVAEILGKSVPLKVPDRVLDRAHEAYRDAINELELDAFRERAAGRREDPASRAILAQSPGAA